MKLASPPVLAPLTALLVASCASERPLPTTPAPRAPSVVTSPAPAPAPANPRSIELARLLAERDALTDPKGTFSTRAQVAPPHTYAIPARGTFPVPGKAARVVLYAFGRAPVAGCDTESRLPFTKAGTLCPDVVAPGVVVEGEERKKVEAIVPAAEKLLAAQKKEPHYASRAVVRCGFDAHHAVAFYDDKGNAIAKILVCFTCGEWIVSPSSEATGGTEPTLMSAEERATLAAIFDAHGLAAWAAEGPLANEVRAYERETYGTEKEPTALGRERREKRLVAGSGAPASTASIDLSPADRGKLCAWSAGEVRPTREHARDRGYECDDGRRWVNEPSLCEKRASTCTRTVGEIEACLRVYREPEDLCAAAAEVPAPCRGLLECLPGITRRP